MNDLSLSQTLDISLKKLIEWFESFYISSEGSQLRKAQKVETPFRDPMLVSRPQ